MGKAEPFILSTGFLSVTELQNQIGVTGTVKPTGLGKHKSFIFSATLFQLPTKKSAWVAQPLENHKPWGSSSSPACWLSSQ